MQARWILLFLAACLPVCAQSPCPSTPAYSLCEMVFELNDAEAARHPEPYTTVQLHAEFRSPKQKTFLMPAYWDGGRRFVVRFAPTEAGDWVYRVTSNVERFNGKVDKFAATDSKDPGFIRAANVHHWAYTESNKPHLWMGDTNYKFASMDRALFERYAAERARQKFNHVRGLAISDASFSNGLPNIAWFKELDARVALLNKNGIIVDLILAGDQGHMAKLFPTWQQRERYMRYIAGRYAAMNVTWQLVQEFEEYKNGRPLMKEVGLLLRRFDPYAHPRSTHALKTSAPLLADGWMTHVVYQSSDDHLGAIEHQLYPVPFVNAEFGYEDSGAGKSHPHHVDFDTFRHRLWNATMNGQYPTFGNTGIYGGKAFAQDAKYLDSPGAKAMTAWWDFFSRTRHWELEPYFDVDGGRAIALEDVEYIVYVEKPSGPVEIETAKHSYQVYWFNPANGEFVKQKDWKGERFVGEPPDKTHDWVLHLSRDGRKEGMLNSYRFESRDVPVQEVESSPQKVPFEITGPMVDDLSLGKPAAFTMRIKRDTRATRNMLYLWMGEVAADGQGFRVLGTGPAPNGKIPADIATQFPAVMSVRLVGMNANGKVYSTDKVYGLTQ